MGNWSDLWISLDSDLKPFQTFLKLVLHLLAQTRFFWHPLVIIVFVTSHELRSLLHDSSTQNWGPWASGYCSYPWKIHEVFLHCDSVLSISKCFHLLSAGSLRKLDWYCMEHLICLFDRLPYDGIQGHHLVLHSCAGFSITHKWRSVLGLGVSHISYGPFLFTWGIRARWIDGALNPNVSIHLRQHSLSRVSVHLWLRFYTLCCSFLALSELAPKNKGITKSTQRSRRILRRQSLLKFALVLVVTNVCRMDTLIESIRNLLKLILVLQLLLQALMLFKRIDCSWGVLHVSKLYLAAQYGGNYRLVLDPFVVL